MKTKFTIPFRATYTGKVDILANNEQEAMEHFKCLSVMGGYVVEDFFNNTIPEDKNGNYIANLDSFWLDRKAIELEKPNELVEELGQLADRLAAADYSNNDFDCYGCCGCCRGYEDLTDDVAGELRSIVNRMKGEN